MTTGIDTTPAPPLERLLRRDIRAALAEDSDGRPLDPREVRYLVDLYYTVQNYRIRSGNQVGAAFDGHEPHALVQWSFEQFRSLEASIQRVMDAWTEGQRLGRWVKSLVGIGPVLSAGLLAHIDLGRAPHVGHLWSFAGLTADRKWLGAAGAREVVERFFPGKSSLTEEGLVKLAAETRLPLHRLAKGPDGTKATRASLAKQLSRRPWNAKLKTLCWKIGQSFVKSKSREGSFYGPLYDEVKGKLLVANERGEFEETAAAVLEAKRIGKDTEAYKAYSIGKLPPAHIDARARRHVVKLFLSHYHEVGLRIEGRPVPEPYAMARLGHADKIEPPNWPM